MDHAQPVVMAVDDDPFILRLIRPEFESAGWKCETHLQAEDALAAFLGSTSRFDVVVTDLRMPGMDGLELIARLRETSDIGIIALSMRSRSQDILAAFDRGVDDYVTKPFDAPILVARTRSVLRRAGCSVAQSERQSVGALTIDPETHTVFIGSDLMRVTRTEFGILLFMAQNAGRIVSPDQILRRVWGDDHEGEHDVLRVAVSRLRKKIEEDPAHPRLIKTHIGFGYSMGGPESIR